MPKCHFNKVTKQFYWNRTSAWVFSCKFAAQLFSEHFFLRTPLVGCFWYFSRRETRKRWLTESNTFWISTVINKLFNSEVSIICNISDISRPVSAVLDISLLFWIYFFSIKLNTTYPWEEFNPPFWNALRKADVRFSYVMPKELIKLLSYYIIAGDSSIGICCQILWGFLVI